MHLRISREYVVVELKLQVFNVAVPFRALCHCRSDKSGCLATDVSHRVITTKTQIHLGLSCSLTCQNARVRPAKAAVIPLRATERILFLLRSGRNCRTLYAQNYKLVQSIKHRDRMIEVLRKDVEQYRKRQNQDDSMLCIINRCWNRFDDDVRFLVQRFDADASTEDETRRESSAVKNFLSLLSQWEFDEIEPKMLQRVEASRRALKKLIQAFERLNQRNKRLTDLITGKTEITYANDGASTSDENVFRVEQIPEDIDGQDEQVESLKTKKEELENHIGELQFQLEKTMRKEVKLESRLYDVTKQLDTVKFNAANAPSSSSTTNDSTANGVVQTAQPEALKKIEDLKKELDAAQKININRLKELNDMLEKNKAVTAECEKLRIESQVVSADAVKESPEFKLLQTQFAALLSESIHLKSQLQTTREMLQAFRDESNKNLEDIKRDEQSADERHNELLLSLEDQMNAARRDYEQLRMEFEQNVAGTDHTSPAAKELKAMVTSMKTMNDHLKQESGRFKRKWKETLSILAKAHKDLDHERKLHEAPDYTEDAARRIRYLEEQNERLKKEAATGKNEEVGLMDELDSIGHAFEQMQEQNLKLVEQLKERDDANLKLMSEQLRGTQSVKKLKEECDLLNDQTVNLRQELSAQVLLLEKVEEREKLLIQQKKELENQIGLHYQAMENSKRKTAELAQQCADRQLQLERVNSQLAEAQNVITKKTALIETDSFKIRRLEEEKLALKRKIDQRRKFERADNIEDVLMEEIREMKDMLKCPSCKVKTKDAILTKCFHVFCMDCLKTRYETRRRKCPKCNAAFGANDFRRVYIS
uniref:E3 ubiquitin protein ligase n=1 Tax=Steinernema glaseri TaxID=37863 RepID=A0A1I7ZPI5_9BILA